MPITCKICNRDFEKLISNSHLKTHNISTVEYKLLHGENSLSCPIYKLSLSESRKGENNANYNNVWSAEQKLAISEKNKGKEPWNKGKKVTVTPRMAESIVERENRYKSGELVRNKTNTSQITKDKISIAVSEYAINNPEKTRSRAIKAVETKKNNGYDFGKNMRDKTHTPEALEKIKLSLLRSNLRKSLKANIHLIDNIEQCNLTLIENNYQILSLQCNKCNTVFSLGRQCFVDSKFRTDRCPTCFPRLPINRSKGEIELYDYIKSIANDAVPNVKHILGGLEIDIYIPSKNIAVEYNGLYWHSEEMLENVGKHRCADNEKRKLLKEKNIKYIAVFEDEWISNKEIVKSRIQNILGGSNNKIFARKCTISLIDSMTASKFCNQHHLQGAGRSNVRYGLFYNNELISVMTFSNNNLSRKIKQWEINRFCSKIGYSVVGGASRLFKKFINDTTPTSVISYADSRWSVGDLYKELGFEFIGETVPNYWYVPKGSTERIHRFSLRKPVNELLTEKELRKNQGYIRIWDCGSTKWLWKCN